ncbi:hypothetical protein K491DRAFT_37514 [Lophiostoma macrostomum CBS 122681]|uniref:C2H2-type domain-containing protein n=1 Tax=Lophiostoma macrostomum CBS 122681 TaxID=1314788 RepID=A0A6A6TPU7_9PLEO|nr:hypothetical protein K491DRAFT_37514 [Lophiostoma macrostomum CBS 122681]
MRTGLGLRGSCLSLLFLAALTSSADAQERCGPRCQLLQKIKHLETQLEWLYSQLVSRRQSAAHALFRDSAMLLLFFGQSLPLRAFLCLLATSAALSLVNVRHMEGPERDSHSFLSFDCPCHRRLGDVARQVAVHMRHTNIESICGISIETCPI